MFSCSEVSVVAVKGCRECWESATQSPSPPASGPDSALVFPWEELREMHCDTFRGAGFQP